MGDGEVGSGGLAGDGGFALGEKNSGIGVCFWGVSVGSVGGEGGGLFDFFEAVLPRSVGLLGLGFSHSSSSGQFCCLLPQGSLFCSGR